MKILKTGCGNDNEAFIEDRFTEGVNIILAMIIIKVKLLFFKALCMH